MTDTALLMSQHLSINKSQKKLKICLCIVIVVAFVMWSNIYLNQQSLQKKIIFAVKEKRVTVEQNTTYVLLWTDPTRDPVKYLGQGKATFINRKCPNVNCYVSFNRWLFNDIRKFDVIVFHGSDIIITDLPKVRSPHQKYVFASMESSDNYPMCEEIFDDFFNLTWTYKLNSDILYPYFIIKDSLGNVVGPKENMQWKKTEEMDPISYESKKIINKKRIAAAWFASNCRTISGRENLVLDIISEMLPYDMELDIYGSCGSNKCPRHKMPKCLQMLEQDYFYYISFENSLSSDYVTEKLLNALKGFAVPIVYGGANYTRFMPDGSYLDAKQMKPAKLADKMMELILDKEKYYGYFKWHNHYSYQKPTESPETDPYCNFCSTVNERFNENKLYYDFRNWWNMPNTCA